MFYPDEPVESVDEDRFDHRHFVDVLNYVIHNCEAPLNIALYGKWGVGKSSILNFFSREVSVNKDSNDGIDFVIIDVWKLSPRILKQEFLDALNQKLGRPLTSEKIDERLWHHKEESSTSPKMRLRSQYVSAIAGCIAIAAVLMGLGHYSDSYLNQDLLTSSFVAVLIPIFVVMGRELREISKSVFKSTKTIIPRIESHTQFQQLFHEIVGKEKARNKLIIAIDNLDRCDDESVVSILNMIKTFLSDSRCVFVVACDQDAVIRHLQGTKGQFAKRDAKEFLTKFFQAALYIPNQIKGQMYEYAKSQLDAFSHDIELDPNVPDVFANAGTKNPRKIRQFVHNFAIAYKMASIKEDIGIIAKNTVTGNTPFLAKVTVLREDWPDFFQKLEKKPTLLDEIQEFINEGGDSEQGKDYEAILEANEGLAQFLKSTSTTKSTQVLTFIQLGQESFESSLSDLDGLIAGVNRNDAESVKEIMNRDLEKQHEYVLELCRLAEEYVQSGRTQVATNSLNVLLNIHGTVDAGSQKEIVELFDKFMTGNDMLDNLMVFDMDTLLSFAPLLNPGTREKIYGKYAQNLSVQSHAIMILQRLVAHAASISDPIRRVSDENLKLLAKNHKELFYEATTLLAQSDAAAKFVGENALGEIINFIQAGTKDRWTERYLGLKHLASGNNKMAFVEKLLPTIEAAEQQAEPVHKDTYETLRAMTSDDFTSSAALYAYNVFKNTMRRNNDDRTRALAVDVILRMYAKLDPQTREEFGTEIFAPLIAKSDEQILAPIAETVREENARILEFERVADHLFSVLQTNPTRESADLVYAGIPKNKWRDYEDRLLRAHDIRGAGVVTLSSAFGLSARAPRKLREKIFGQILESSRQFSPHRKLAICQNLSRALDGMGESSIDAFVDRLLSELGSADDDLDAYLELIGGCLEKSTKTKQRDAFSSLFSNYGQRPASRAAQSILNLLSSKHKSMNRREKRQLGKLLEESQNAHISYPEHYRSLDP